MSITATTLSGNIGISDTYLPLTSISNVNPPNGPVGGGSIIQMDQEMVIVAGAAVGGSLVPVQRGQFGTCAQTHAKSCPALVGLPSDFAGFRPGQAVAVPLYPDPNVGVAAPVASAGTIAAPSDLFHVTGVAAIATITLPPGTVQPRITMIADGAYTTTTAGNIAAAMAAATVGTAIDLQYDASTAKWYPVV